LTLNVGNVKFFTENDYNAQMLDRTMCVSYT